MRIKITASNTVSLKPQSARCYCYADWLVRGELQKMVLVITSSETKETLERWTFDLQTDKSVLDGG